VLTSHLLGAADKQFDALISSKLKDKKKLGEMNERMGLLLECLRGRDDKKTETFLLRMFSKAEPLTAIRGEPSGKDLLEKLVSVMENGPPMVQAALVDSHRMLPSECLHTAFIVACRTRPAAEVFKLFSPYLTAKVNEKKKSHDPAYAKREAIVESLAQGRRTWYDDLHDREEQGEFNPAVTCDPQWLDLAIKLKRADLVQSLARPGHKKSTDFLSELFKLRLGKSGDDYERIGILSTMVRVGHPEATDAMIEMIRKCAKEKYSDHYHWLGRLIQRLPKAEAVPKLESLLPTLPERMIVQLLDYVTELKNSPEPRST
jgi:hypothetical protein